MSDPTREDYDSYEAPGRGGDAVDRIMAAVDRAAVGEAAPPRRRTSWRWPAAVALAAAVAFAAAWIARGSGGAGAARVEQGSGSAIYDVVPGTSFEVVTPAGTARALGTRFRVEVRTMKRSVKRGAIAATAAALVVVTVYEGRVLLGNQHGETDVRAGQVARASTDGAPRIDRDAPAPDQTVTAPAPRTPRRFANADERAALSRAIAWARERRATEAARPSAPEPAPAASPALPRPVGALDKDYIRERVRDVLPLLTECYTLALEDAPELAGKLVTEFVISGEPEIGGLVEESTIADEGSTISHPGMRECIRETLYSIEFEPPPDGGKVLVRYPFEFRPDDSDSDVEGAQRIDLQGP